MIHDILYKGILEVLKIRPGQFDHLLFALIILITKLQFPVTGRNAFKGI